MERLLALKYLRLPPRIKVLEALGAVADNRVRVLDDKRALVISSDGYREYKVYVDVAQRVAFSSDNGTRLRGYVGYPIIAFLMLKGELPFDPDLAKAMKGIPWRMLNERYKRYAVVETIVKDKAKNMGVDPTYIDSFIDKVLSKLRELKLRYAENSF